MDDNAETTILEEGNIKITNFRPLSVRKPIQLQILDR